MDVAQKNTLLLLATILAIVSLFLTWTSLRDFQIADGFMSGASISTDFSGLNGSILHIDNFWLVIIVVVSALIHFAFYSDRFAIPSTLCNALAICSTVLLAGAVVRPFFNEGCYPGTGAILCLIGSFLIFRTSPAVTKKHKPDANAG